MGKPKQPASYGEKPAAAVLVDALLANGVTQVFCVPGESYLAILDALYEARDRIQLTVCRHEAGAANMAEAYAKLTGKPGVAMVTRGPGATHAAVGLHTAYQDSTPIILFIGQVARDQADREAFQEIEYRRFLAPITKWAGQVERPARMVEYVNRAFATAQNGRPGPVALALPEDVLTKDVPSRSAPLMAAPVVAIKPDASALQDIRDRLCAAKKPFVLVGGGGWTREGVTALAEFAEKCGAPIGASFRAKDLLDNRNPSYAGDVGIAPNPVLAERVRESDVVLALGPRLGEMTTSGYTLFDTPHPMQQLIHVHPGAEELGRVFTPALAVNASPSKTAIGLAAMDWPANKDWRRQTKDAHAAFQSFSKTIDVGEGVNLSEVFSWLSETLPPDAIVCNGAGNYAAWLHRFYQHKAFKTQLAPTSGAMGYGLPASIAAKSAKPDSDVVCVAGDGCFMMASPEFATLAQYGLGVIVLVINNASYGTIRMHQERDYPGRVSGTALINPDFAAYAKSFGAFGARVEATEAFPDTFISAQRATKAGGPALIEIVTATAEIAPGKRL
ncbi:MAG: thiamine pyrophosphate-binding protein [Pseudomonadota bacterium]